MENRKYLFTILILTELFCYRWKRFSSTCCYPQPVAYIFNIYSINIHTKCYFIKQILKNHPKCHHHKNKYRKSLIKKTYLPSQEEYHPIELYDNQIMNQKLEYILENPVKDGIVLKAEDYLYSIARNYAGYSMG